MHCYSYLNIQCIESFPLSLCCVFSRSMGEENFCREIFDEYVSRLQEKVKEKERKREEEKVMKIWKHKLRLLYPKLS